MAYLDWLEQSLAAKLAAQPIGEPVALRVSLRWTSDHGLLVDALAANVALAAKWFGGSEPATVYAQGGPEHGVVSALASFSAGQTAVLSSELIRDPATQPSVRLLLVGNHGTIEFYDEPGSDGSPADLTLPTGDGVRRLRARIEHSLRQGAAVSAAP